MGKNQVWIIFCFVLFLCFFWCRPIYLTPRLSLGSKPFKKIELDSGSGYNERQILLPRHLKRHENGWILQIVNPNLRAVKVLLRDDTVREFRIQDEVKFHRNPAGIILQALLAGFLTLVLRSGISRFSRIKNR